MAKKKSPDKKTAWVSRTLIESPLCIGLCLSEESFRAEMKRLKVPAGECPDWLAGGDAAAHIFEKRGSRDQCAIVCIEQRKESTPEDIVGVLIHEAVHVWQYIKNDLGEECPSKEFEAYSIQAISQRLIAAYGKFRKMK